MGNRLNQLHLEKELFEDLKSVIDKHTKRKRDALPLPEFFGYKQQNALSIIIKADARVREITAKYGYINFDSILPSYDRAIKEEEDKMMAAKAIPKDLDGFRLQEQADAIIRYAKRGKGGSFRIFDKKHEKPLARYLELHPAMPPFTYTMYYPTLYEMQVNGNGGGGTRFITTITDSEE